MCRIGLTVHQSSTVDRSKDVTFSTEVQWMSITHQRKAALSCFILQLSGNSVLMWRNSNSFIHENKESLFIDKNVFLYASIRARGEQMNRDADSAATFHVNTTWRSFFDSREHKKRLVIVPKQAHMMMQNSMITVGVSCCSLAWSQTFLLFCMRTWVSSNASNAIRFCVFASNFSWPFRFRSEPVLC